MGDIFPRNQVLGFVSSLILTAVALSVYFLDASFDIAMTILLITAFIQAGLQLIVFMHAGETEERSAIFTNLFYAVFIGLVTVFGTLLTMIWGYM
ncbi:cytochrome aa3 quinol oxidase subunit IV [Solibacillus daqui]|uniref:cytochrome aa3 quinol oxidase subunit IV n=1 Tax=Solibacillus daqui TaxID=2912187 RepID=UPI00236591E9|nr:cytochrome aa3 quinol oxidase subunit IV [Solibacillus daqui]